MSPPQALVDAAPARRCRPAWTKADAYSAGRALEIGQKRIDDLLKLAAEEEKVEVETTAHVKRIYTVPS
jgi:hypothetical protein